MRQVEFAGDLPGAYEAWMRPMLFDPYAVWTAERALGNCPVGHILEIAAGTGALTRQLIHRMDPSDRLVATDLQQAMLEVAVKGIDEDPRLTFQVADAQDLPFEDAAFDLVLCQFGYMFFPDKVLASREVARVLRPGGRFGFSVWNSLEQNEVLLVAKDVVTRFLGEPPKGFDIPFGFSDQGALSSVLLDAGFEAPDFTIVDLQGYTNPSDAAKGMLRGLPLALDLAARLPDGTGEVEAMLADELANRFGPEPFRPNLSATCVEAARP